MSNFPMPGGNDKNLGGMLTGKQKKKRLGSIL